MGLKHGTTEKPTYQRWNQERNKKSIEASENTAYQNLWDAAKTILRRKFMIICTYIKK